MAGQPSSAPQALGIAPVDATEESPLLNHRESEAVTNGFTTFEPSKSSTDSSSSRSSTFSGSSTDEEALIGTTPVEEVPGQLSHAAVLRIILVLLIAVFVFNADGSLVLATHPVIASEFNALESSSWLFTGFGLAGSATQATFGKLSDIYGRKPIILICYAVFAIGCIIVGTGQSMIAVILGRVLSGSVGAGMTVLVSILITDLIPIRDVATWRAYVNVAATTGRSLGGPLGGWLADVVGWRWSFLGQAPILLFAILLCWRYLPNTMPKLAKGDPAVTTTTTKKLARVDFLGSFFLGSLILSLLLPLEIGGIKVPWNHPLIPSLFGLAVIFIGLFIATEKWLAKEPILPLELFHRRDAVASFIIMGLQVAAQIGLMFSVPLYFQVTKKVSNTEAGAHLFPAVLGNAVGGVLSGVLIKKTGKYKWLVYFATLSSVACYSILLLRWHGNTNWWESFYIIPGGFGTGVAQSVLFVSLQASIDPVHIAPAVSTLYLTTGVGSIVGLACMSAVTQEVLRSTLHVRLVELGLSPAEQQEIISKAVSSVEYVYQIKGKISEAVVASYVDGLWYSHGVSLTFAFLGFVGAFFLREHRL